MRKSLIRGYEWWRKKEGKYGPYASFKSDHILVCVYSGMRRNLYEYEYPYSLCFCEECKTYKQGVRLEYLDMRPNNWPLKRIRSYTICGDFCEPCTRKLKRYRTKVRATLETKSLINRMIKELKNGPDQNNRTTSPVSV